MENPKAGSTSIHALFLRLMGIESKLGARATYDAPSMARTLTEAGLERFTLPASALSAFIDQNRDAFWFTVVRHPYPRTISNYYNKLSRYTLRFERGVYWYGKLRQVLEGPAAWGNHTRGIHHMQRRLSFEQFVEGLDRHGIDFDIHFGLQSRQLHVENIPYTDIFALDDYELGMRRVLSAIGIDDPDLVLGGSEPLNASSYQDGKSALLTEPCRELIRKLYQADFEAFAFKT